MEKLGNLINDAISSLRSNKKQPNENARYSLTSSKLEWHNKEQLEERLNCLVNEEELRNTTQQKKPLLYRNKYCQFVLIYGNAHPTLTTDNHNTD